MRWILIAFLLISMNGFSQWKDYLLSGSGDTLNRVDLLGRKQGPWTHRYESLRGEPGYEEEGWYKNNRKEGVWRLYSLVGDLVGMEQYRWGLKDGLCQYFSMHGNLQLEQTWKAINPDKIYDTIDVEDPDKPDSYKQVIVKNEGAAVRHGVWKYYDPQSGSLVRTETYMLGKLEQEPVSPGAASEEKKTIQKPKEVLEFEKKNEGKKKIKVRDGSTGS